MKNKLFAVLTAGLLVGGIALATRPAAAVTADNDTKSDTLPAKTGTAPVTAKMQAPVTETTAPDEAKLALDARFALVSLKLAEVNLAQAEQANGKVPGTYQGTEVDRLKQVVSIARFRYKRELDASENKAPKSAESDRVRAAEDAVRAADENWRKALRANQQVPNAVNDLQLQKLRLIAEAAKLNLARAKAPMAGKETIADVQWQLDQLRDELLILQFNVNNLGR